MLFLARLAGGGGGQQAPVDCMGANGYVQVSHAGVQCLQSCPLLRGVRQFKDGRKRIGEGVSVPADVLAGGVRTSFGAVLHMFAALTLAPPLCLGCSLACRVPHTLRSLPVQRAPQWRASWGPTPHPSQPLPPPPRHRRHPECPPCLACSLAGCGLVTQGDQPPRLSLLLLETLRCWGAAAAPSPPAAPSSPSKTAAAAAAAPEAAAAAMAAPSLSMAAAASLPAVLAASLTAARVGGGACL